MLVGGAGLEGCDPRAAVVRDRKRRKARFGVAWLKSQ